MIDLELRFLLNHILLSSRFNYVKTQVDKPKTNILVQLLTSEIIITLYANGVNEMCA